MQDLKAFFRFLRRCLAKWWEWVNPNSAFIAKFSFIIMVVSAVVWLIAQIPNISDEFYNILNNIGFWGFWVGFGFSIVMLIFWAPFTINKEDKEQWESNESSLKNRNNQLMSLEKYKNHQVGNEQEWLHLILEYIDIDKRANAPDNQIVVKFNFDSGLVYEFKPYRLWVTPIVGGFVPAEPQYEMLQTSNFLAGKRSQMASIPIIVKDKKLLECLEDARLNKTSITLRVQMQLIPNGQIYNFDSV